MSRGMKSFRFALAGVREKSPTGWASVKNSGSQSSISFSVITGCYGSQSTRHTVNSSHRFFCDELTVSFSGSCDELTVLF